MFENLTEEQKEEKFNGLINYAKKINNNSLRNACINILNDYKQELFHRGAGHDGIEMNKYNRTHQCFDGGLLDHLYNVTKNAYDIGLNYKEKVDIDLILFGAILHDIGKVKIFDKWNENGEIKSNLNYSYLLVDHVYIGEKIVEEYLDKEDISEKFKYQALHIIATHMDTMDKHMAEAYIVSYADSIDADIENIISYPRNAINPVYNEYYYESENPDKIC
ncbi:HD domain-containing protein [bacterium]|nr:HD domain-containing protein [bacterium]